MLVRLRPCPTAVRTRAVGVANASSATSAERVRDHQCAHRPRRRPDDRQGNGRRSQRRHRRCRRNVAGAGRRAHHRRHRAHRLPWSHRRELQPRTRDRRRRGRRGRRPQVATRRARRGAGATGRARRRAELLAARSAFSPSSRPSICVKRGRRSVRGTAERRHHGRAHRAADGNLQRILGRDQSSAARRRRR